MPIVEISYAKKLSLRNYSNHSFSVSVKTEVPNVEDVEKIANQQYVQLQDIVDRNLQEEGFVPEGDDHRSPPEPSHANGNGSRDYRSNGNGSSSSRGDYWRCSDKQRDLIQKIIDEHRLDIRDVEQLSDELHRKPLKTLNKLEMSSVLQELLDKHGPAKSNGGNGSGRREYNRGARR